MSYRSRYDYGPAERTPYDRQADALVAIALVSLLLIIASGVAIVLILWRSG